MNDRRTLRGLPVLGAAFGAMVVGHWLSYLVGLPSGHLRGEVLTATGHRYWMSAVELAVALGVVALATVVVRQFRTPSAIPFRASEGPGRLALRLAALQVLGFTTLEVGERIAAGAPVSSLLQHHLFLLGLLVQVAVAAATAVVLFWFARATGTIARALVRPRFLRSAARSFPPVLFVAPASAVLSGAGGSRGPPAP
jgi:hypothetical protein